MEVEAAAALVELVPGAAPGLRVEAAEDAAFVPATLVFPPAIFGAVTEGVALAGARLRVVRDGALRLGSLFAAGGSSPVPDAGGGAALARVVGGMLE